MKTSECLYCGMLTSSENSICETCDFAVSAPQNHDDAVADESNYYQQKAFNDFGVQQQATPENSGYSFQQSSSQASNNNYPPRDFRPPRQTEPRTSCVICHRQIPAGQRACFTCSNKNPVKKFTAAFAVLAALAIVGIGIYGYKFYLENSPTVVLKKYATATGSDKMGDIQNLTFKGKVDINLSVSPPNKTLEKQLIKEIYSFEMILQNPNKSYMVFYKTDPAFPSKKEIVYKQGFDGFNGWKYSRMFNQPATLEDSTGDSKGTKPEIFLDNYDSVDHLTDAMREEYGEKNLEPIMSISSYSVDGNEVSSKSRVAIQVVKNNQKTLLIFDKESSLLLGIFRKETINKMPTVSNMYVDNYKTVTIKGKNSEDISVLMPTRWKLEMQEAKEEIFKGVIHPMDVGKPMMSMSMIINITNTESGSPAEDKLFFKPISVHTADKEY